jgi:alpha-mannosidase
MKNVVFWDIETHFVLHRRHITSPLQTPTDSCYVRFEVFTAVTMKKVVFWDIETHFVLHRRHITSPLQTSTDSCYVRFEDFTASTMKNGVFWDVTPCGSYKSRRFEGI